MAELPTALVERFEVRGVFAMGRAGATYRAIERTTGRAGLLKVVGAACGWTAAERGRLSRELEKLVTLRHPHLAEGWGAGLAGDLPWLFREEVPGESLRARIESARNAGRAVDGALYLACEIAAGLDEVHRAGLLQRDLSPEHVIVRPDGSIALVDTGIASRIATNSVFEVAGKAPYVSPEHASGKLVSFRSDLYALGCLLHEMLTGRPPFEGPDDRVLEAHRSTPVTLSPAIPTPVAALLAQLLQKDPRDRPFSAQQVRRTLEPLAGAAAESARGSSRPSSKAPKATLLGIPAPPSSSSVSSSSSAPPKSTLLGIPAPQTPKADSTEQLSALDLAPAAPPPPPSARPARADGTEQLTALDLARAETILAPTPVAPPTPGSVAPVHPSAPPPVPGHARRASHPPSAPGMPPGSSTSLQPDLAPAAASGPLHAPAPAETPIAPASSAGLDFDDFAETRALSRDAANEPRGSAEASSGAPHGPSHAPAPAPIIAVPAGHAGGAPQDVPAAGPGGLGALGFAEPTPGQPPAVGFAAQPTALAVSDLEASSGARALPPPEELEPKLRGSRTSLWIGLGLVAFCGLASVAGAAAAWVFDATGLRSAAVGSEPFARSDPGSTSGREPPAASIPGPAASGTVSAEPVAATTGSPLPSAVLVRITIDSEPPGAQIVIDGEPAGTAPVTREVPRGSMVRARAILAGHSEAAVSMEVSSDGTLTLHPQPLAAAVAALTPTPPPTTSAQQATRSADASESISPRSEGAPSDSRAGSRDETSTSLASSVRAPRVGTTEGGTPPSSAPPSSAAPSTAAPSSAPPSRAERTSVASGSTVSGAAGENAAASSGRSPPSTGLAARIAPRPSEEPSRPPTAPAASSSSAAPSSSASSAPRFASGLRPAAGTAAPAGTSSSTSSPSPSSSSAPSVDELRAQARDHFQARRYREAADAYERATRLAPTNAGLWSGLGAARLQSGDTNGAVAAYERAVQLAPTNAAFHTALGRALLQGGNREAARRAFQRALELDPRNQEARAGLARL